MLRPNNRRVLTLVTHKERIALLRFLQPRYWLIWPLLALARGIARLPYRWQMRLGRALGRLALLFSRRRKRIAIINLDLCLPQLSTRQRKRLLRRHFESFCMGLIEVIISWWVADERLKTLEQIEGLQHLQDAFKKGKGVILLSAHFTSLEIGGRLLARHCPFHVVYRRNENPLIEHFMRRSRDLHFDKAIPRDDIRGMIRSLRENKAVWYAADQNYGRKYSVFAPFFGVQASTHTATSRIAKVSGAPVVPFFTQRRADGKGYRLILLPPLKNFPSADPLNDTTRINALIEAQVRQVPEQYFWTHRRFKHRPPGIERLY
ncbi:MAG: LpxL/LpxP family Kdo(2)-lipid IV(A) lauroyl/palmitoleoyl acyltransferase [Gammaproteobacteria bacterium]|nr:LpxL/LpxP family Kdo(2)-lipid IV(A) lauroyl/palmitoleoyl acyltransferase [Gammaproteobacteria bacterium]